MVEESRPPEAATMAVVLLAFLKVFWIKLVIDLVSLDGLIYGR